MDGETTPPRGRYIPHIEDNKQENECGTFVPPRPRGSADELGKMFVPPKKWTRRDWLKAAALIGGTAGVATFAGIALYRSFFPPAPNLEADRRDRFVYTSLSNKDTWWNHLAGEDVRVTDFQDWQGASAVWHGFPALVIRVKRESEYFRAPTDLSVPPGYSLYCDDPDRDLRIVAFYDRSTHLCCYPGWHVVTDPPPGRDYIASCPTYEVFDVDPIYDVCQGGQWDPLILEWGVNPASVRYVGARMVRGPGFGPLPSLLVRTNRDVLYGGALDMSWYFYC